MKNLRIILTVICVSMIVSACNQDEIYKKELYENVIALVSSSNDNSNILEYTHELGAEETGYIVASCGGTEAVGENVFVSLTEDIGVLDDYNWNTYEIDVDKYARPLPPSNYVVDEMLITIPKGEHSGWTGIRIKPNGMSPDSVYFLPISISATSAYKVNPEKSNMLYRVLIKNQYAEQLVTGYSNYKMDGFRNGAAISILEKPLQPLTAEQVRMMAGNLTFEAKPEAFKNGAVVLQITGNKVKIKPYKEGGNLVVTQLSGDPYYPNTYQVVNEWDRKFREFLLHYSYVNGTDAEVVMKERLRMEIFE